MAINHRTTVVGVFRDRSMAEQAMQALANAGFDPGNIRFSGNGATGGFLDGIRSLFAGPAANESGIANDLNEMGLSDEEAHYYSGEYANGNTILAVKAEEREQEASSIMQQFGAYNYDATRNPQGPASYPQQPVRYATSSTTYPDQHSYAAADENATDPLRDENATDPLDEERSQSIADEPTQVYPPRAQANFDASATNSEKAQDHQAEADMKQAQTDSNQAEGHPIQAAVSQAQAHHDQAQADREQEHATNQYAQANYDQKAAYDSRPTQPVTPYQPIETETVRVAQASDTPANRDMRDTRLEDLQTQFQTIQQQLQEAQNQLKAAKEREQELKAARERETQYQSMQQQLQEMQAQLQATLAELHETQSRISQHNS